MRSLQFHEKFALDRSRLAALIHCLNAQGEIVASVAAAQMGVGESAAKGAIGWLAKSGLGISKRGRCSLSPLGSLIAQCDPELNNESTLWLVHYHFVTDHNERAEFWYRVFNEFLTPGMQFTRLQAQTYVERCLEPTSANNLYVKEDVGKFVSTYTTSAALGKLDLLREVSKGTYEAGLSVQPEAHAFAFALFDAWQRRFPHVDTLRVSQICEEPEFPGKVFAARRDQVVQQLQALQSLGMVNLVDSQHEPVTRRFRDDPTALLTTYFASL